MPLNPFIFSPKSILFGVAYSKVCVHRMTVGLSGMEGQNSTIPLLETSIFFFLHKEHWKDTTHWYRIDQYGGEKMAIHQEDSLWVLLPTLRVQYFSWKYRRRYEHPSGTYTQTRTTCTAVPSPQKIFGSDFNTDNNIKIICNCVLPLSFLLTSTKSTIYLTLPLPLHLGVPLSPSSDVSCCACSRGCLDQGTWRPGAKAETSPIRRSPGSPGRSAPRGQTPVCGARHSKAGGSGSGNSPSNFCHVVGISALSGPNWSCPCSGQSRSGGGLVSEKDKKKRLCDHSAAAKFLCSGSPPCSMFIILPLWFTSYEYHISQSMVDKDVWADGDRHLALKCALQ